MADEPETPSIGLLDTCVIVDYATLPEERLPDLMAVSAITMAELHAGPQYVRDDPEEMVRRQQVLNHAQNTFGQPLPFDAASAQAFGSVCLLVLAVGRKPRRSFADLLIASIAIGNRLPLYTRNPGDFEPLRSLLRIETV